jgi:hypothetical protein
LDELYEKLNRKLNSLTRNKCEKGQETHTQTEIYEKNRVENLTNITFTKEQIKTLELFPQYAIEKNPKYYINELIIDTENAIQNLHSGI